MISCTRRLEFDYGHRLLNHEGKCAHVHGHRGTLEITCSADALDVVGRVLDFGEVKRVVGGWVDEHFDHAFISNPYDHAVLAFLRKEGSRLWVMPEECAEPSAENIAWVMLGVARDLLRTSGVEVRAVRFYETPNGWADAV